MNPTIDYQARRVAITGLGVICPLGNSVDELNKAMSAGKSGVDTLSQLPPLEDRVVFGGEASDFTGHIDNFGPLSKDRKKAIRKALKMMCRETMMAVAAAQLAIADAGYAEEVMEPERSGIVFGSDYMLSPPDDFVDSMTKCDAAANEFDYARWGTDGLGDMNPLWMLKYLPNMPASHIAIFNDLRGPNNSLTLREIAGIMAIREATQTIARGHADRMIAGATGTRIHSFKTVHAMQQEQLADPTSLPAEASRPFDAHRTGMVVGEGAGAIVLEELESARERGATIYGVMLGTGSSTVADKNLKGSTTQAMTNAISTAMAESHIPATELGHINAHGLATPNCDRSEASAIHKALGESSSKVPVFAPKSYFGNLGAASSVVELVASLQSMTTGDLYQTLNYSTADPESPELNVSTDGSKSTGDSFLKISVTPQSQAAAVVVGRI